ncbi:porin family protein [Bacteroides acidifaciens]|uniref:porin family protein n=1 Tax=Bacteroides acidifaciens TaxID=85831 RepID=UPI002149F0B8|nr:porin family protein [Bacteroides acidifaciens]MCR2004412.1 porin family protein [Bacteroides acidifaciens]
MKKENDEITELFRTRLADAGISVRDGFWEELSQDIPVACQHHRRILLFRVAAAASVLLVLAASSATFLYFSPKEEMEEAFTKIAVTNGGQMDGDGIRVNQLPLPVEPVLPKPTPKSFGMLSQRVEEEDSLSITFSMSFSFSSTATGSGNRYGNQGYNGYWQAANGNTGSFAVQEETARPAVTPEKVVKRHRWAIKAQLGTALPADDGTYKMPLSAGVTVERKLNDYLGIETGLLYSNLRSEGQYLHYLGIPVRVNVTLMDTKKVDLYATVGGIADKCIVGAPDNSFKEEPVQLAVTAGIGINYKINDRLALFAEPGISHHFSTDSKLATVCTKRPTNFNLLCGLRMTY